MVVEVNRLGEGNGEVCQGHLSSWSHLTAIEGHGKDERNNNGQLGRACPWEMLQSPQEIGGCSYPRGEGVGAEQFANVQLPSQVPNRHNGRDPGAHMGPPVVPEVISDSL